MISFDKFTPEIHIFSVNFNSDETSFLKIILV